MEQRWLKTISIIDMEGVISKSLMTKKEVEALTRVKTRITMGVVGACYLRNCCKTPDGRIWRTEVDDDLMKKDHSGKPWYA